MALFKDPAYSIPHQQGDEISTKDMLYIGVFIAEGDTSRFHLVMKNCFATPTQYFYGTLKYYIIRNSCNSENDKTIHITANGIASYGKVSIQAFKFIGAYNQVYLHCQVHLCDYMLGSCVPFCPTGRIGIDVIDSDDQELYISLGAIAIKDTTKLCPDLQCGATYINVTFEKNELIASNVDIQNLHLNENHCHDFYDSGSSVSIGWPLGVGKCGTTLTTNATHAIYENAIYLAPNPSQIIYREDYFINVSCTYPLDMNVTLHNVLNPIISTIYIIIEGIGHFEVIMAAFKDPSYLKPFQLGELELSTKDRLYVGVFISKGDTQQFNIVMKQCYATPTNNAEDSIKYPIIQDSCPNEGDGTIEVHANGIASQGQFSTQMFKFINHSRVYLHCGIHLCNKLSATCIAVCPKATFRSAVLEVQTMTFGPIHRLDTPEATSTVTTTTTTTTTVKDSVGKGTCLDLLTIIAVLLCWRF